jgi:hypothetical protein
VPATLKRKDIEDPTSVRAQGGLAENVVLCPVSNTLSTQPTIKTDIKNGARGRLLNCMMVVGRPQKTSSQRIFLLFPSRSRQWPETNQAGPRGPDQADSNQSAMSTRPQRERVVEREMCGHPPKIRRLSSRNPAPADQPIMRPRHMDCSRCGRRERRLLLCLTRTTDDEAAEAAVAIPTNAPVINMKQMTIAQPSNRAEQTGRRQKIRCFCVFVHGGRSFPAGNVEGFSLFQSISLIFAMLSSPLL